jgi:Lauroyl/myristoyl acyltransferase
MLLVNGLSRKTGARVVFVVMERLPQSRGFLLHLLAAPEEVAAADPQIAATALNQGVETCVNLCIDQYQWSYKRFQRRPEGAPSPYRGPM